MAIDRPQNPTNINDTINSRTDVERFPNPETREVIPYELQELCDKLIAPCQSRKFDRDDINYNVIYMKRCVELIALWMTSSPIDPVDPFDPVDPEPFFPFSLHFRFHNQQTTVLNWGTPTIQLELTAHYNDVGDIPPTWSATAKVDAGTTFQGGSTTMSFPVHEGGGTARISGTTLTIENALLSYNHVFALQNPDWVIGANAEPHLPVQIAV